MKVDEKVLVTGATGFIGGRFVEILHLTKFLPVRAAIYQWSEAARLGRFPVEIIKMDLMNRDEIEKALEGISYIIHCAKGAEEVTVKGTENLLEFAFKKQIKHFIHFSTAEVYGNATGEVDENVSFEYTGNAYNKMKIDAEKRCWDYSNKGCPITVIRPAIVYGPFSKNWTVKFAQMMVAGEWGIYENYGDGMCNLIYVDDLVGAILKLLNHEKAVGEAFNINGPEIITWNEYFRQFNNKLGLPALKIIKENQANYKTALMKPVRWAGGVVRDHFMEPVKKIADNFPLVKSLMKQTEHTLKITPVKDELNMFSKNIIVKDAKIRNVLNWQPKFTVNKGLEYSVDWIKHHRIIS